jgi:hypothetical protein
MEGAMEHYIFQNRNILMDSSRPLLALDEHNLKLLEASKMGAYKKVGHFWT